MFLKCNKNLLTNNKKNVYQISKDEHFKEINTEILNRNFP